MNNYNINISEYRILLDDNELNDDIINFLLYDTDNEGILEKLSILNESQIKSMEVKYENDIKDLKNNL